MAEFYTFKPTKAKFFKIDRVLCGYIAEFVGRALHKNSTFKEVSPLLLLLSNL